MSRLENLMLNWILPFLMAVGIFAVIFGIIYAVFIEPGVIEKRKEQCSQRGGVYLRHTEMVGKTMASSYYCLRFPAVIELKDE